MQSIPFIPCDLGPTITLSDLVAHRIRPEEKALGEPDALYVLPVTLRTGAGFEALDSRHLRGGMAFASGARHGISARAQGTLLIRHEDRSTSGRNCSTGGGSEAARVRRQGRWVAVNHTHSGSTPDASKGWVAPR